MSDMYIRLGTFDLTGKVYDDIKQPGGYFDIKQDGATSLITGARKGDPKGSSCSFFVCFDAEAAAKAFLAYVAPYSPEDPDFDETEGADIDLYVRTADWKFKVWGVVTKAAPLNKQPTDYLQYCYDVTCYLYSPYSDSAQPILVGGSLVPVDIATRSSDNCPLIVDQIGRTWYLNSEAWMRVGTVLAAKIAVSTCTVAIVGKNDGYLYLWDGVSDYARVTASTAALSDVSIANDCTVYGIISGEPCRWSGAAWVHLGGFALKIAALSATSLYVIGGAGDVWHHNGTEWSQVSAQAVTDLAVASDGTLVAVIGGEAYRWSGASWASFGGSAIEKICVSGAGYAWAIGYGNAIYKYAPSSWTLQTRDIVFADNSGGHMASAPDLEVACSYNSGRAANVTVAIADSETLILATQANSAETWELRGNRTRIIQTYEDLVTDDVTWLRDVASPATSHYTTGTPAIGWIEVHAGEAPYFRLSGPHPAGKPAKLWAPIIAGGECSIEVSPDAVAWTEVLSESDFHAVGDSDTTKAIATEFSLQGTEYMTDIYVRFRCDTGNMWIGSIKFEVERWIEYGAVPVVAAGATKLMTVSATGGAIAVNGTFTQRQKFI